MRQAVESEPDIAAKVRAILEVPDERLNYADAKLALDALVDPMIDVAATATELDRWAAKAAAMSGKGAPEGARLGAIRQVIYESGPWNDNRPFRYNLDNPEGTHIPDKLLGNYLRSRRGNCVSMPILMLVLAEKLGIDMRLASAPCHVFLRYRSPNGQELSIEATSSGYPARLEWFRQNNPMTDQSIESGLYMRTLSRRQSVALMAETVLAHLIQERRHAEVIEVSKAILIQDPRTLFAMYAQAMACIDIIMEEYAPVYPSPLVIPLPERPRLLWLQSRSEALLRRAEALGWDVDLETPSEQQSKASQVASMAEALDERRARC